MVSWQQCVCRCPVSPQTLGTPAHPAVSAGLEAKFILAQRCSHLGLLARAGVPSAKDTPVRNLEAFSVLSSPQAHVIQ